MAAQNWQELLRQADALTVDEQLRLGAYLVDRARRARIAQPPPGKWCDLCGAGPCRLVGEDSQSWVSRTRREEERSQHGHTFAATYQHVGHLGFPGR